MKLYTGDLSPYSAKVRMQIYAMGITDIEFELPVAFYQGKLAEISPIGRIPVLEFADVVRGQVAGRTHAGEVTIFDSVGFALEDYSTLCLLHRMLREQPGVGRRIDLIPTLDDPKDLFGGTLLGHRRLRRAA